VFDLEVPRLDRYACAVLMSKEISKTQIDRLGDRIKRGHITEDDLRLLDRYRRSFTPAYEVVVGDIRNKLDLEPTGRPAKSTTSIADKLKRESIRLTQIQDIAGCRIVIEDIEEQESVTQSLKDLFPQAAVMDRRAKPSHGYRAVHVIVNHDGRLIEIQVRTRLQQVWAELSEKYSDIIDPSIKYGGGDSELQEEIQDLSTLSNAWELQGKEMMETVDSWQTEELSGDQRQHFSGMLEELRRDGQHLREAFKRAINRIAKPEE
jgi:putative GTP pyrophosphokinase